MIVLTLLLTVAAVLSGCWWAYRCAILGKWSLPKVPLACLAGVLLLTLAGPVWRWVENWGRPTREEYEAVKQQAENNAEVVRQVDRYVEKTTIIREKAKEAEANVRALPSADEPLDPGERDVLCAELERVRGTPVCTASGVYSPHEAR